jgi:hypothetical protein
VVKPAAQKAQAALAEGVQGRRYEPAGHDVMLVQGVQGSAPVEDHVAPATQSATLQACAV